MKVIKYYNAIIDEKFIHWLDYWSWPKWMTTFRLDQWKLYKTKQNIIFYLVWLNVNHRFCLFLFCIPNNLPIPSIPTNYRHWLWLFFWLHSKRFCFLFFRLEIITSSEKNKKKKPEPKFIGVSPQKKEEM